MSRYLSPQSQGESLSTMERAPSPDSGNSGSSHDAKGEQLTPFHLCTSIFPVPVPTARSAKRKASDLSDGDHQVDAHQAKQQSKLAPVAMAEGNVPLKKTWDLTALKERRGLLSKFRVGPLSCHPMSILTLKGARSPGCGPKVGAIGQLGRPIVKVKSQCQENGESDVGLDVHMNLFLSPGPRHLKGKAVRAGSLGLLSRCGLVSGDRLPNCNP